MHTTDPTHCHWNAAPSLNSDLNLRLQLPRPRAHVSPRGLSPASHARFESARCRTTYTAGYRTAAGAARTHCHYNMVINITSLISKWMDRKWIEIYALHVRMYGYRYPERPAWSYIILLLNLYVLAIGWLLYILEYVICLNLEV